MDENGYGFALRLSGASGGSGGRLCVCLPNRRCVCILLIELFVKSTRKETRSHLTFLGMDVVLLIPSKERVGCGGGSLILNYGGIANEKGRNRRS